MMKRRRIEEKRSVSPVPMSLDFSVAIELRLSPPERRGAVSTSDASEESDGAEKSVEAVRGALISLLRSIPGFCNLQYSYEGGDGCALRAIYRRIEYALCAKRAAKELCAAEKVELFARLAHRTENDEAFAPAAAGSGGEAALTPRQKETLVLLKATLKDAVDDVVGRRRRNRPASGSPLQDLDDVSRVKAPHRVLSPGKEAGPSPGPYGGLLSNAPRARRTPTPEAYPAPPPPPPPVAAPHPLADTVYGGRGADYDPRPYEGGPPVAYGHGYGPYPPAMAPHGYPHPHAYGPCPSPPPYGYGPPVAAAGGYPGGPYGSGGAQLFIDRLPESVTREAVEQLLEGLKLPGFRCVRLGAEPLRPGEFRTAQAFFVDFEAAERARQTLDLKQFPGWPSRLSVHFLLPPKRKRLAVM